MKINDYKCFVARDTQDGIVWLTKNPDLQSIRGKKLFLFTEQQLNELVDAICLRQRQNCNNAYIINKKITLAKQPNLEEII